MSIIQSHLSWKISPLHLFFIICIDPANEYLYSGEVRKKSEELDEIFFLFMKKCENVFLIGEMSIFRAIFL